jgi:hypothetical protein
MTFVEFKKLLLDANITLPKFSKLIKVSEKNLQAYKKKEQVPNAIAVIARCFASMQKEGMDYVSIVNALELKVKTKESGFAKKKIKKSKTDIKVMDKPISG